MECKKCKADKPESEFYTSNRTQCKECLRAAAIQNRLAKIEYYRSYDRERGGNPDRVAAREAYQKTPQGKAATASAKIRWRESNPKRRKAHNLVNAAVRDGRLEREPCFICGRTAQAHHADYDQPLLVTWLCSKHHKEAHAITGIALHQSGEAPTLHY